MLSSAPQSAPPVEVFEEISAPPQVRSTGLSDTVSPTLQIVAVAPDPRNIGVSSVLFKFSEPVTGFDLGDLILERAFDRDLDLLTGAQTLTTSDDIHWTLNGLSGITAAEGFYTLTLRSNGSGIRDLAGNFLAVGQAESWLVDRTPPAVVGVAKGPAGSAVSNVTIVFSEAVFGFDLGDLVLSRSGGANLLTSAQVLAPAGATTFTLSNLGSLTSASGQYTLSLRSGNDARDAAGNLAQGRQLLSWGSDATSPTVAITQVVSNAGGSLNSVTFTFSEPVLGFNLADLRLTRSGSGNLLTNAQTLSSTDNRVWTLGNLAPTTTPAGTYTLSLPALGSGITDLSGNVLAESLGRTWTVTAPATGPRVTIIDVTPEIRTSPVNSVVITFDQAVQGFEVQDLLLQRDGGPNLLTAAQTLTTADRRNFTLGNLAPLTGASGHYLLTFKSLAAVTSDAGQPLASAESETWTMVAGSLTGTVVAVTPSPRSEPVDSLTIVFSAPVTGLELADLALDVAYDDKGNLLTSSQTLTTTDRITWRLGNLRGITTAPGKYVLTLAVDQGVVDPLGNPLTAAVSGSFTVLPKIAPGDDFLRMILNAGHHFWDSERFRWYMPDDGDSYLTIGTRVNYASDSAYNALGDPVLGLSNTAAAMDARDAYQMLYDRYKRAQPKAVVGSYLSAVSVKTEQSMIRTGHWPPDAMPLSEFAGLPLLPSGATSTSNDGYVDVRDPASREALYNRLVREVLGQEGRPRQDILYFDEVGYVYTMWPAFVDLFSRLKQVAHEHGSLIGFNLGGWGWTDPFPIVSPDVVAEVAAMADLVTVEGIWSREPRAPGGSFRTVDNTAKIVANLRDVLDRGVAVGLIPRDFQNSLNVFNVVSGRETTYDGQPALLLTLSAPHHIFPHGGSPYERFGLDGLPAQYRALQGQQWTPVEVPGRPDQVILYNRFQSLNDIKSNAGISGTVSFAGGQFIDYQATIRLTAALAMMIRRPGDSIFVTATPRYRPGDLAPNNPDNWFTWPAQFGAPRGDYVVSSVQNGLILHMYRDFQFGRIEIFPQEGWVRVQLWAAAAGSGLSADPIVRAAAGWDTAADATLAAADSIESPWQSAAEQLAFASGAALATSLPSVVGPLEEPTATLNRAADTALLELHEFDWAELEGLIDASLK